jgi:hypothetical protein
VVVAVPLLICSASGAEQKERVTIVNVLNLGRAEVRQMAYIPGSSQLLVSHGGNSPSAVYQWNLKKEKLAHTYDLGPRFFCDEIRVSPDAKVVVVACCRVSDFDAKIDWGNKALILNPAKQSVIRSIDTPERIQRVQFTPDSQQFLLQMTSYRWVLDNTGRPVTNDVSVGDTNLQSERAWRVEPSKGRPQATWGLHCRDDSGQVHLLTADEFHDNFAVTTNHYVAATTWKGELVIWRLSDGKEIFRKKMAERYGYLTYDPDEDRILWADALSTKSLKAVRIQASSE